MPNCSRRLVVWLIAMGAEVLGEKSNVLRKQTDMERGELCHMKRGRIMYVTLKSVTWNIETI